jgi:hypothetical protein
MGDDPAFDNFDIYVYEYPTSRFGECLAVSDLATEMQTHLKNDSVFENHEKVVFLAHSMGGLIVRTFLLRYREAADQVPMLFFFATPSAGSRKANLASLLPTCSQVKDLRTLDINSFLKNQQSDWSNAKFRDRIVSHCAFETETSYGSLAVERGSATLLCTTESLPLPTAHSEIVKPDSTSDLAHKFVKNALSDLPTTATQPETKEPVAITCGPSPLTLRAPEEFFSQWEERVEEFRHRNEQFQDLEYLTQSNIPRKAGIHPVQWHHEATYTLRCLGKKGKLTIETVDPPRDKYRGEFENLKFVFPK